MPKGIGYGPGTKFQGKPKPVKTPKPKKGGK